MKSYFVVSIALLILINYQIAFGYDEKIAHPKITENAVKNSILDSQLSRYMGPEFSKEYDSVIDKKKVIDWLKQGATEEDTSACRATNHFHNPLFSWSQSFMTDQPDIITLACADWLPLYSNVTWATNYSSQPPGGSKAMFSSTHKRYNWDGARILYYHALISKFKGIKDYYFAQTFLELGHVLHLLQDMAVPAHTRNDFQSHLFKDATSFLSGYFDRYQPFEKYVEINPNLVTTNPPEMPSISSARITDFWDTDTYNGSNPSTLANIGLAEFTNANYFSDYTIPTNGVTSEHSFPYPYISGSNTSGPSYQICVDYAQNSSEKRKYISRKDRTCPQPSAGRTADHFATASLVNPEPSITNANIENLKLWLDNNVHNTYAKELLPRAVGYSAGLLDYFFRGSIDISLPGSGVYSLIDASTSEFTNIKLLAKNSTSNGDDMSDGSIELVVKYKTALSDPFTSYPVTTTADFSYIVVPEKNNVRSLSLTSATELNFDLSRTPLPLYATDVYIQIVYKGKLGNEDGAVAVGLKDISEPTPLDIANNMDRICINGSWYDAGSQAAITLVGTDTNGAKWDVFPHDLNNLYIKLSSSSDPQDASLANYDFSIPALSAGYFRRALYFLSDYRNSPADYSFKYSFQNQWTATDPKDYYNHSPMLNTYDGTAVKNQEDYVEDTDLCNGNPSCYTRIQSAFFPFRGIEMWWGAGVVFVNPPYPAGSQQCSY